MYKIGIKDSEICGLCKREKDSNEHMLILCDISNALWSNVETWIRDIGIDEYNISQENNIGRVRWGILDKCNWMNTKKCIFTAKIGEIKPTLLQVKANVTLMHNYEKFSFQMKNKEHEFTRRWGVYTEHLDDS